MTTIYVNRSEVAQAVVGMLQPMLLKGRPHEQATDRGVGVFFNKKNPLVMLFMFYHRDGLEITLQFDAERYGKEGTKYADHIMGTLQDKIMEARKKRYQDSMLTIGAMTPANEAMNRVMH